MKKNLTGRHSRCTNLETIEVLRRMSGRFPDDQIAATLNRLGLKTGTGNTWNEGRVRSVRSYHELPRIETDERNQCGDCLLVHLNRRAVGALGDPDRGDRVCGRPAGSRPREAPSTESHGGQRTIHADVC